jgi:hypothetical protein
MLIDWLLLLPALIILWLPVAIFHGRHIRYRELAHGWSGYWGRTLSLGLHTIDAGRAMLGAWWLSESISAPAGATDFSQHQPIFAMGVVLAVATILQTLVWKRTRSASAPFAFVGGLVAGFLPPLIAGFSLLLAIVFALGIRSPMGFFPLLSISTVGVGVFFTREKHLSALSATACVVALPWLLALLFRQRMVVSYLAKRTPTRRHSTNAD